MRTAEEVLAYLESELDDTYKELDRWRFDEEEYKKHRIAANNLEHLTEDIAAKIEADAENESVAVSNCEPAKVLASVPKEKITFLDVYVNAFAFLLFVISLLFMSQTINYVLDLFELAQGLVRSFISYGYYALHIFSFAIFSMNADRTYTPKKR